VPYTGATASVNLGAYDLTVNGITIGIGAATITNTYNTAFGYNVLASNTTGKNNIANGNSALNKNLTGSNNLAIGGNALTVNTSGSNNTSLGFYALSDNTTGYYNTANGGNSLSFNTTGYYNTGIGRKALYNNTTGSNNNAFGGNSMYNNNGDYNSAFGYNAGYDMSGNNNCTLLGANTDVSGTDINNATAIGYNAKVGSSNSIILGTAEEKVGLGGIIAPLDALHIKGNLRISNSINSYNDVVKGTYINTTDLLNWNDYLYIRITLQILPNQELGFYFKYDIGLIGNSAEINFTQLNSDRFIYGTIYNNSLSKIANNSGLNINLDTLLVNNNVLDIPVFKSPNTYTDIRYLVNYEYFIV
jgi:hypothetical protein